jgi:hypothetical protein
MAGSKFEGCGHEHKTKKAAEKCLPRIDKTHGRVAVHKVETKKKIRNLKQLHAHVGSMSDDSSFDELAKGIAHRLYKDTSCGIGFHAPKDGKSISISGYCEGTDAECVSRELRFPFTPEEFDEQVEAADQDGNNLWNETHGCDECGMGGAVNPECKSCGGEGIIL